MTVNTIHPPNDVSLLTHNIGSNICMTQVKKSGPSSALKSRLTLLATLGVSITPINSAEYSGPGDRVRTQHTHSTRACQKRSNAYAQLASLHETPALMLLMKLYMIVAATIPTDSDSYCCNIICFTHQAQS